MQTGENEQGLRKILDLTRMISMAVLLIHFYYYCYAAFSEWQLRTPITDRLLQNIFNTGLFSSFYKSKLIALLFLIISLVGARGKKDEKLNYKTSFGYIITGLFLYFISYTILYFHLSNQALATIYIGVTVIGLDRKSTR